MSNEPDYACCGILHSSSGFLPQTLHSPRLFLIIGLLVAQVPLNSLPVKICLILISPKAIRKKLNMMLNEISNSFIVILYSQCKHKNSLNRLRWIQKQKHLCD